MHRLNLLLLAVLMICALSLVTVQFQSRRLTNDVSKEQDLQLRLDEEYRQLQVEQSTWSSPKRVSDAAIQSLGMQAQNGNNTIVVQLPMNSVVKPAGTTAADSATKVTP
jgi:cell division protein FtsL